MDTNPLQWDFSLNLLFSAHPQLKKIGFADFNKIKEGIEAGEIEATKKIRIIKKLGKRNLLKSLFGLRN